jgi:hypothetical protein
MTTKATSVGERVVDALVQFIEWLKKPVFDSSPRFTHLRLFAVLFILGAPLLVYGLAPMPRLPPPLEIRPQNSEPPPKVPQMPFNAAYHTMAESYVAYIIVKRCYDLRQGYLAVYISEHEMAQATRQIKLIEQVLKPQLGETIKGLWSQADDRAKDTMRTIAVGDFSNQNGFCQQLGLLGLSMQYEALFPNADRTPKDF